MEILKYPIIEMTDAHIGADFYCVCALYIFGGTSVSTENTITKVHSKSR